MRLITISNCKSGTKLGQSIYNQKGKVLLAKGTELTDSLINKLKKYKISSIYIDDEVSAGIEIVESIPAELRTEAINVITEGLNTIVGLNSTSKLEGMIKTGRAIRSFQKIFKDIQNNLTENPTALNLLAATKINDNVLYTHSLNVAIYACQLGIENGLPLNQIEELGLGAMLHDVGKMFISPKILNKQGPLTNEEFQHVKTHTELGFDLLRKVHDVPLTVAHCAFQHHERYDGSGYPRGLKGDQIHSYSKILSVADFFDAVTSHREYRPAMLPHKGIELLYAGSGTQFERKQIELFKGCVAIYPQGITVKLNDGRTGIVTNYHFHSVGRPEIRIIRNENDEEIDPYEIDLSSNENLILDIVEAEALLY